MLRTHTLQRDHSQVYRAVGIGVFTLLTIVSARVSVETGGPVPFTLQPLAVLLAGMVLGGRDGALSQLAYAALIAAGLPVDARGIGTAAFFGPTGGYLVGFVMAAWLAGALVEHSGNRLWQRWLAGVAGVAMIYLFGVFWLRIYGGWMFGMTWEAAFTQGALKFLGYDMVKAVIAAALTEGGRALLLGAFGRAD